MKIGVRKREDKMHTHEELIQNLGHTIEGLYSAMYHDMVLIEALYQGIFDAVIPDKEQEYIERVFKLSANISYSLMSLCVILRSNFNSAANVEKQYNLKRSVVMCHEIYKYLFGFTSKRTEWQRIENNASLLYPEEHNTIKENADKYLIEFAQQKDKQLRDVSKHFSTNPEEFYDNIDSLTEQNVCDRVLLTLSYAQPIHNILVSEKCRLLGRQLFEQCINEPMPTQHLVISPGKNDDFYEKTEHSMNHYSSVVSSVMTTEKKAESLLAQYHVKSTPNDLLQTLLGNSISLHIMFVDIDTICIFRALLRSESYPEKCLNLAYFQQCAHEGFKKLYGFTPGGSSSSFWNRSIVKRLAVISDAELTAEAHTISEELDKLSKNRYLSADTPSAVFSHLGYSKEVGLETYKAVLENFRHPSTSHEAKVVVAMLNLTNRIVALDAKILHVEQEQQERKSRRQYDDIQGTFDKIDKLFEEHPDTPIVVELRQSMQKTRTLFEELYQHK